MAKQRSSSARLGLFVVSLGVLGPGVVPQGAAAAPACSNLQFPVALAPDQPVSYQVTGRLCGAPAKRIVQVLVAGATESGLAYWDFPHPDFYESEPAPWATVRERYSYAKYLADAGYASLTLDRIGTGASGHPPAEQVTIGSNAFVLHQVVQALRRGRPSMPAFDTVISVGHSLGADVVYVESVTYGDVDGIISQAFRQHRQPPFAAFPQTLEPAQAEPRFGSLPPGYMTTRPGTRKDFFFTADAERSVVDHEEAIKDTVTAGEVPTFAATFVPGQEPTRSVSVPVLSVVGEKDRFFCTNPGCLPEANEEAGYFEMAKCFESHVISDTGHSMTLEPTGRSVVSPLLLGWVQANFDPSSVPCAQ